MTTPIDPSFDRIPLRVRKRSQPVEVTFASAPGRCETLEGVVAYDAGDALLTGSSDDRWPIQREILLAQYEPVLPTIRGQNGRYRKRPTTVLASRLTAPLTVPVGWQNDPLNGQPGDWLLQYEDGSHGVIQDAIFRHTYEPAPGEDRWPPP